LASTLVGIQASRPLPASDLQPLKSAETNLYKFGTRYYDPTLGRFTQMDLRFGEVSDPMSLNRYQYAGCDPVNLADPTGLWSAADEKCFFAALGVLVGSVQVAFAIASAAGGVAALAEGAVPVAAELFLLATQLAYDGIPAIIEAIEDANAYCD
jgi:RHS repeat-associated protein